MPLTSHIIYYALLNVNTIILLCLCWPAKIYSLMYFLTEFQFFDFELLITRNFKQKLLQLPFQLCLGELRQRFIVFFRRPFFVAEKHDGKIVITDAKLTVGDVRPCIFRTAKIVVRGAHPFLEVLHQTTLHQTHAIRTNGQWFAHNHTALFDSYSLARKTFWLLPEFHPLLPCMLNPRSNAAFRFRYRQRRQRFSRNHLPFLFRNT